MTDHAVLHTTNGTRMIQDLEKDWGLTLLERRRTGVRLTPDGFRLPRTLMRSLLAETV